MTSSPTEESRSVALRRALEELAKLLGDDDAISQDAQDLVHYGRDWTRRQRPAPLAIVFATSVDDVSRILTWATAHQIAIVPSGGRTGLAGGAVAAHGEVVLSLEKMRAMGAIDTVGRTVVVDAGVVTAEVHAHAAAHDLFWPIDFASKGTSQVGGNLSTNAGGVRVVRYGSTSRWVLGLTVVLMDGRILSLGGDLEKDNTGVDLKALFLQSEGTLGVICSATLKLCERPRDAAVLFVEVPDLACACELFVAARNAPAVLNAFEVMSEACLDLVISHRGLQHPFAHVSPAHFSGQTSARSSAGTSLSPARTYVLIEFEPGRGAPKLSESDVLHNFFDTQVQAGTIRDGVVGDTPKKIASLWELREGISEALSQRGKVHKNDVSVGVARVPAFVEALQGVYERVAPELEVFIFGHVGDGNLHLNLVSNDAVDDASDASTDASDTSADEEAFAAATARADAAVYPLIQKFGGSVSAEHGVGTLKLDALRFTRGEAEIDVMRMLKRGLDPHNLLNPGKVIRMEDA